MLRAWGTFSGVGGCGSSETQAASVPAMMRVSMRTWYWIGAAAPSLDAALASERGPRFLLADRLRRGECLAGRHALASTRGRGQDRVARVWSHDRRVGTEPEQFAGPAAGVDQLAQRKHALEPVREGAAQHGDVGQQVARLHAAHDAKVCETWHIGGVDDLGVFQADRKRDGETKRRSGLAGAQGRT